MTGHPLQRYLNAVAAHGDADSAGAAAFAARHVGDVMTRTVFAARTGTPFKDIAKELDSHHVHGVPVVDDNSKVIGMVTASDLLARVAGTDHGLPRGHRLSSHHANAVKRHGLTAKELMTTPPVVVTTATTIADAARLAAKSRVRTLPVVDADGRLIGVVTRDDLIRIFLRPDEDIHHDVEHDVVGKLPRVPENRVSVEVTDGVVTLHGTVTTALTAGRLLYQAGRVPGVVDVRNDLDYTVDDAYTLVQW